MEQARRSTHRRTTPGFAMFLGVALAAAQVYVFVLALISGRAVGGVGALLLLIVAGLIVSQIYGLVRLCGTTKEYLVYPMTFVGLLLSLSLLTPLWLSTF